MTLKTLLLHRFNLCIRNTVAKMVDIIVRKRYKKNGEVIYEYRFEIAVIDGKRQWKSKSGYKTVTEARKAGKEALRIYENIGRIVDKDAISYSDFLDFWFEQDCRVDLKPTTLENYKKKIDNIIKPKLGSYRLKSLTREILQAFLINLYDEGFAYNTLTVMKGILTKSLNFAEDHHYLTYCPAVRLKIPKNRIPKNPTRSAPHVFIPDDVMKKVFVRFPERTSSFIPLKLGYECGLRLGEVFALCWEDIDFDQKTLSINRQVQWLKDAERLTEDKILKNGSADGGNGYWYFSAPKYDSYRTLELSNELIEILLREKERQVKAKDYYGIYYTNYGVEKALTFNGKIPEKPVNVNRIFMNGNGFPIHMVCIRENGTFISPRTMQHTSRIIKKVIFNDFDFHSLRHTHASILAELRVNQKYIQTRLGHSNLNMTIDVYEHITDLIRSEGRHVLNTLFSSN